MELLPTDAIRASTYNPRLVDPVRLDLIELSLRKLGFLIPIYADPDGEVISGHQRLTVAERLGVRLVPVETTRAMDLPERKGVNIAFNRGTNDLSSKDTPATLAAALERIDLDGMAADLPDLSPIGPRFYRCMTAEAFDPRTLIAANRGRLSSHARNVSWALASRGINMPVIAVREGLHVVNGMGRLHAAAERGVDVSVVWIAPDEAELADAMLNLLSMDFDLHNRYADVLRFNSFSRARNRRAYLGRGFLFDLVGDEQRNKDYDVTRPASAHAWRQHYGNRVVDFGAGHGLESTLLRSIGVEVAEFEPYRLAPGDVIDATAGRALTLAFLEQIADERPYSSVFCSSVLNSVPFETDRRHLVTLLAALSAPTTRVYAKALSTTHPNWKMVNGADYVGLAKNRLLTFNLGYEPGIRLGDVTSMPKMQKYHSVDEFRALFAERFELVRCREGFHNDVELVASGPRPIPPADLDAAIAFEFDLPYPDGSTLGLVEEARVAFENRVEQSSVYA